MGWLDRKQISKLPLPAESVGFDQDVHHVTKKSFVLEAAWVSKVRFSGDVYVSWFSRDNLIGGRDRAVENEHFYEHDWSLMSLVHLEVGWVLASSKVSLNFVWRFQVIGVAGRLHLKESTILPMSYHSTLLRSMARFWSSLAPSHFGFPNPGFLRR